MAIAFGMFGLEVAIFTYVATLVAHEVPTMVIGAYIIHKLKHRIVRNEGTK
jgi:ACR3 family arsenite efflux pump ArsB